MKCNVGKCNVGETDKILRICIALVFISAAYLYNVWWLYVIALIPLITALFGYCPAYTLFGISTVEKGEGVCQESKEEKQTKQTKRREGIKGKKGKKK